MDEISTFDRLEEPFSPVIPPAQDESSVSRRQRQGQGQSQTQSQRLRQFPSERIVSSIKGETKQSKRIPYWMWIGIAKTLGIRRNPKEKPVLAWVLHLATITSATVMGFTRVWFSGYDIASLHTQSDVLDGTVSAIMIALFVGLGIYSHRLAYRLFVHPKVLEMMRLHSKTFIKLNTAGLLILLLTTFVVVLNASSVSFMYNEVYIDNTTEIPDVKNATFFINPCQTVQIPIAICKISYLSQVIFSTFFLLWNTMVAAVLVSVARTHTIAIRKFICQLEIDAHLIDKRLRTHLFKKESAEANDSLKNYLWLDVDNLKDCLDSADEGASNSVFNDATPPEAHQSSISEFAISEIEDEATTSSPVFDSEVKLEFKDDNSSERSKSRKQKRRNPFNSFSKRTVFGRFHQLSEGLDHDESEDDTSEPYILQEEEILYKHWKLSTATRFTSNALQRWTSVAILTIVLSSAVRIVSWLSHNPTVIEVLSFIIPLLLLPLIASTYAEVNFEGVKVLQSILPTMKRTGIFRYLYGMPIQMTVYGHPVTYGTMGTVFAAVIAAFLSKVVLQEMNRLIDG